MMKRKQWLTFYIILGCILAGIGLAAALSSRINPFRSRMPAVRATWVWHSNLIMDDREELLAFTTEHHINLIYLYYDSKIPDACYRTFIKAANARGMQVYALSGEPSWALRSNRAQLFQFVSRIRRFNEEALQNQQFRGVNLDIEPYLLPDWSKHRESIIKQWTDTLIRVIPRIKGQPNRTAQKASQPPTLKVSLDLPFWLNEYMTSTPFGKEPLSRWMMQQADQITFMAYRNHALGKGGILDILKQEIDWAKKDRTPFVVGLETRDTKEKQVTFHKAGAARLRSALIIVNSSLHDNPSYQGYAIHEFSSWRILTEPHQAENPEK